MDHNGELLDTPQAARILDHSPFTLERWRVTGNGPRYLKFRGKVRYRRADLDAFLAAATRTSTSDQVAA